MAVLFIGVPVATSALWIGTQGGGAIRWAALAVPWLFLALIATFWKPVHLQRVIPLAFSLRKVPEQIGYTVRALAPSDTSFAQWTADQLRWLQEHGRLWIPERKDLCEHIDDKLAQSLVNFAVVAVLRWFTEVFESGWRTQSLYVFYGKPVLIDGAEERVLVQDDYEFWAEMDSTANNRFAAPLGTTISPVKITPSRIFRGGYAVEFTIGTCIRDVAFESDFYCVYEPEQGRNLLEFTLRVSSRASFAAELLFRSHVTWANYCVAECLRERLETRP